MLIMLDYYVIYPDDMSISMSDNFKAYEYMCKCKHHHAHLVHKLLVSKLQSLRQLLNVPITINSGYRCPEHNRSLKNAAKYSKHTIGLAADIVTSLPLETLFTYCRSVGLRLIKEPTWAHVEVVPGE